MTSIVVGKDRINLLESERYLAGTKNLYTIKVSFSDDWCDLEKRITFKTDKFEMSVAILGMCETLPIPWEVFREPSTKLQVGAYGYRCNELALNTRWASLGRVWKGMLDSVCGCGHPNGPMQPSPKSFEILQAMIERKADRLTYEDEMLTLWSGDDPLSSFDLLLGSVLPTGGLADQVLAKASDKEGDYCWMTLPEIPEIPNEPEPPQEITKEININLNIPQGMVFLWFGPLDSIPAGYSLCDGQNGTIDLRDVFIVGAGNEFEPGDTNRPVEDDGISTMSLLPDPDPEPEPEPTPEPEPEPGIAYYALAFIQKTSLESADVNGGMSAYEIALANGFEGTEKEWLESLRGAPGKPVIPVISNVTIDSLRAIPEKPNKPEWPNRPEKFERSISPEEPEVPDESDKPEKPQKPNRPMKPAKPRKPIKPGDYIFENVTFSTKGTEQKKSISFKKNVVHLDITETSIIVTLLSNGRYVCELDDSKDIISITYETLTDQIISIGGSLGDDTPNQTPGTSAGGGKGEKGDPGDSAYQIAVKNGFVGTEQQWLDSLKGEKGDPGIPGTPGKSAYEVAVENGFIGTKAEWLESLKGSSTGGSKGEKGDDGDSAYDVAVKNGFTGTEQEWLDSLKGDPGNSGSSAYDVAVKNGFVGTEQQWLDSLKGKSAYDIAVDHGFKGTEEEWLESLKGESTMYGKSAYEIAVEYGFVGTVPEWLESLKGAGGKSAYQIALDHGFVGTEAEWLESLKGPSGGAKGDPGDSAYQIAVKNGFVGTEQQWLDSLKGSSIPTLPVIEGKTIDTRSKMPATGSYIFRNVLLAAQQLSRSVPVKGYSLTDDVAYVNMDYATQATVDTLDNKHLICLFNDAGVITEIREEQFSTGGSDGSGAPGKSAYEIAVANGFVGTEKQWLESLKGGKGDPGLPGDNGASAYDVAVANGYTGTEAQWLESLKGNTGKSAYDVAVDNGYTGTEQEWVESLKGKTLQGIPDYSTGELIAGRWIDNRPIYRKVVRTTVTTSTGEAIVANLADATPTHMYGTIESQNGSALCMVPGAYDMIQYGLAYDETTRDVTLWSSASSITSKELTLVLEYVKDNDGPLSDDDLIIDSSTSDGTKDHRELTNRDAQSQHPIAAITGLQGILDSTPTTSITDEELEELFK